MLVQGLKTVFTMLVCAAMPTIVGCACCTPRPAAKPVAVAPPCCPTTAAGDLPPNAKPGECYAKVFVPPTTKTVTERVCVTPASSRLEVVAAQYEWVEERVCVKEASTELEALPPQFTHGDQTIQVAQANTDWTMERNVNCVGNGTGRTGNDIFCLVSHPAEYRTLPQDCLTTPATVRQTTIPAEYQTVRRQKLVSPATTHSIPIPAEYQDIEKTLVVCPSHMAWQRVTCEDKVTSNTPAPGIPAAPIPAAPAPARSAYTSAGSRAGR